MTPSKAIIVCNSQRSASVAFSQLVWVTVFINYWLLAQVHNLIHCVAKQVCFFFNKFVIASFYCFCETFVCWSVGPNSCCNHCFPLTNRIFGFNSNPILERSLPMLFLAHLLFVCIFLPQFIIYSKWLSSGSEFEQEGTVRILITGSEVWKSFPLMAQ